MMASGLCRLAFTTNFDPVVEKAVEISASSLSAYHLEGAHNAVSALNNEQFPIYCKLHGDFQYDSIKNLASDLATQNDKLSNCMAMAGARFLVSSQAIRVATKASWPCSGPSCRHPIPSAWPLLDEDAGFAPTESVAALMADAEAAGIRASFVDIDTYDTVMLRLWRNLPDMPNGLDAKIRKGRAETVQITLPSAAGGKPILRFNGLPMTRFTACAKVRLKSSTSWDEIADLKRKPEASAVLTFDGMSWPGADQATLKTVSEPTFRIKRGDRIRSDWRTGSRLHIKNFLEEGLARALCRELPLIQRRQRSGASLIVDHKAQDVGILESLFNEVGKGHGSGAGIVSACDRRSCGSSQGILPKQSTSHSIMQMTGCGCFWKPDVWIWPTIARRHAAIHPAADGLVSHVDTAFSHQVFNITQAQRESEIQPHCLADDVGVKAMTL